MRRLILVAAIIAAAQWCAFSQPPTTTTIVGVVKDLTGATVTSGRITFQLTAPQGGVIPGTGAFVSTVVSCGIDANGHPVSTTDGTSPCTVVNNTALTPTGTSYTICLQPYNVSPGSCFVMYAIGGSLDISTIVPVPTTGPYSFAGTPGPPGPMATPSGTHGQVQINQYGVFGVDAGFTYDSAGHVLTAPNLIVPGTSDVHIPPSGVQWPASCSTGTYVPATNTCVATGTAANPGGAASQVQYNAGGTFQGLAGSAVDGSGNVTFPGTTVSKIRDKGGLVYDVKAYGATATGVIGSPAAGTDDAPFFRAAGAALVAAGGGTLHIPPGVYRLTSNDPAAANDVIFLRSSHVHIQCDKGAILYSTAHDLFNIGYGGPGYAGLDAVTRYPFNPILKDAVTSVTMTTASDASHFAAGDAVYLMGGPGQEAMGDSEINWVASSDAGTGIVTLVRPTVKPYNTDGTGPYYTPGSPLNIAMANATNYLYYDESIEGCEAWVGVGGDFFAQGQVVGVKLRNNTVHQIPGAARGLFVNHLYPAADGEWTGNTYYGDPGGGQTSGIIAQPAYGVRDLRITGNTFVTNQVALNPSQGVANVLIADNHFYLYDTTRTGAAISTSTAYGLRVVNNEIVLRNDNASATTAVSLGLSNGSCINCVVATNTIKATGNIAQAISSIGSDVVITGNDISTDGVGINLTDRSTINFAISTIVGNKIHNTNSTGAFYGISVAGSRQVVIGHNNLWADTLYTGGGNYSAIALLATGAPGGTIIGNQIQNFKKDVITQTGDTATISGNTCVNVTTSTNCGFPGVAQLALTNTYTGGTQDFGSAAHTMPSKRGTIAAIPATCTVGEEYFATNATPTQNKYLCTGANTWTQVIPGGGGGGGSNVVANLAQTTTSSTSGVAMATIYTTPAAHQYRLCAYIQITVVATAGTYTGQYIHTNSGHVYVANYLTAPVTATGLWNENVANNGAYPSQCANFYADSGTVIQFGLLAGGVTGTPTVAYSWTLEQLQ